ncbi:DUF5776 domain-containing protein [Weissella tructae]|uniref:TagF_2 protein n=2 Tax=Weissella TaxID=46255 RepID=A0A075TVZ8_9LACO|nr:MULTISPECIES: CDP-glycerol glycerophosphotransferase family protein [Weissella]AIG65744.1 TagF_2 protein [Weissella tructae]AIM63123.1 TagF_2 protein [Weissella ceti]ELA06803.1 CDP-glycerol glycerophosphotransferase [Weissella ceti NC36]QVV90909.1 CDP-glycerol glycerophosphotransferase family protein [Weissella tructae]
MSKLWLFGTYKWQGNPKALFMYMEKFMSDTHELVWIADTEEQAKDIQSLGYRATYMNSDESDGLFSNANVYVTENFRISYPKSLNSECIVFNLWHGVGLKHIEFGVHESSGVSKGITTKHVKNHKLFANNLKLLVTSDFMEEHFIEDTRLNETQIIRGDYPRNHVYREFGLSSYRHDLILGKVAKHANNILLFAPTWRDTADGTFKRLIPDVNLLNSKLEEANNFLIIKMHPHMISDESFQYAYSNKQHYKHILFWNDEYDIYEILDKIDVGIVDYSSILYDMLAVGVDKFIRYIPDYSDYTKNAEFIRDYKEYSVGTNATDFESLLDIISKSRFSVDEKKNKFLNAEFFDFSQKKALAIDELISNIDQSVPSNDPMPELHSFDIFDTLIRRNTLTPKAIFADVQQKMIDNQEIDFPRYLLNHYARVRVQVERDLRTVFPKTTLERQTDRTEVMFSEIFDRLADNFNLNTEQVNFLMESEIASEINSVEPIQYRIDELFSSKEQGNEVILISDMYLPSHVIRQMIVKADKRFLDIPLFVSCEEGATKHSGLLFEKVFFKLDYHFSKWVHYGDNKISDGKMPRRYGIQTINHDMESFINLEKYLVNNSPQEYQYAFNRVATAMQRYRASVVENADMSFDEKRYYAFSYVGTAFVSYIDWVIEDALERGYSTLYFLSRDGLFLKDAADVIIKKRGLKLNTKYLYGSRKTFRVPSFIDKVDDESFSEFGLFSDKIGKFSEIVEASQLSETVLLNAVPSLKSFYQKDNLEPHDIKLIREILKSSTTYNELLLEEAAEQRKIVTKYLAQEINVDESFAIVEFWGRGYTQDTLARLINNLSNEQIDTPFYYVRNFTSNKGTSIRHRFTTMPLNFAFFEPIFAQVPYESISQYEYDENGRVVPVIVDAPNEFSEAIQDGVIAFANAFSDLHSIYPVGFNRYLGELTYEYQTKAFADPYIANVFGNFKYSEAMHGQINSYAPKLSMKQITGVTRAELKNLTSNVFISAAKSPDDVRNKLGILTKKKFAPIQREFVIAPLTSFTNLTCENQKLLILKDQYIFADIHLKNVSKSTEMLRKHEIVDVLSIEWTNKGVPRLRLKDGYISANKKFVQLCEDMSRLKINGQQPLFSDVELTNPVNEAQDGDVLSIIRHEFIHGSEVFETPEGFIRISNETIGLDLVKGDTFERNDSGDRHQDNTERDFSDLSDPSNLLHEFIRVPMDTIISNRPAITSDSKVNKGSVVYGYVDEIINTDNGLIFLKINKQFVLYNGFKLNPVRFDIENFLNQISSGYVYANHNLNVYNSVNFKSTNKVKYVLKNTVLEIVGIDWTKNGTPRLKVANGYVTANKKNVTEYIGSGVQAKFTIGLSKLANGLINKFKS